MTSTKIYVPSAVPSWSSHELQQLRTLAAAGESIDQIAKTLKRSVSAIRNKAGLHGISLARPRTQSAEFAKAAASA